MEVEKMRKTIICSLPFKQNIQKVYYEDNGMPMEIADHSVRFPINSVLEKNVTDGDELKIILLVKHDKNNYYEDNKQMFLDELKTSIGSRNIILRIEELYTEFSEDREVHEKLLGDIIDKIEDNSNIIADITYGPKDVPILIFTALNFCEKHLGCNIEGIVYGLAQFGENNIITEGKMCDMSSLFYLNCLADTVECRDSEKSRELLKTLLSL